MTQAQLIERTIEGGPGDWWAAYTQLEAGGRFFEIRHPRRPRAWGFMVYRWSDNVGWLHVYSFATLDEAARFVLNHGKEA